MRAVVGLLVGGIVVAALSGQAPGGDKVLVRYGVGASFDKFPQDKPKAALASAVKAIELGNIAYLLAHLADPAFVDKRIQEYKTQVNQNVKEAGKTLLAFDRLVMETKEHLKDDPTAVRELQLFAKQGIWDIKDGAAQASLKSIPARRVFLKKIENRWYLEDRQQ
jgi:hypothetical protein